MKILLKIPVILITSIVSLFIWLCAGLISCSAVVFKIASSLLSVIAAAVMLTGDATNGAHRPLCQPLKVRCDRPIASIRRETVTVQRIKQHHDRTHTITSFCKIWHHQDAAFSVTSQNKRCQQKR